MAETSTGFDDKTKGIYGSRKGLSNGSFPNLTGKSILLIVRQRTTLAKESEGSLSDSSESEDLEIFLTGVFLYHLFKGNPYPVFPDINYFRIYLNNLEEILFPEVGLQIHEKISDPSLPLDPETTVKEYMNYRGLEESSFEKILHECIESKYLTYNEVPFDGYIKFVDQIGDHMFLDTSAQIFELCSSRSLDLDKDDPEYGRGYISYVMAFNTLEWRPRLELYREARENMRVFDWYGLIFMICDDIFCGADEAPNEPKESYLCDNLEIIIKSFIEEETIFWDENREDRIVVKLTPKSLTKMGIEFHYPDIDINSQHVHFLGKVVRVSSLAKD